MIPIQFLCCKLSQIVSETRSGKLIFGIIRQRRVRETQANKALEHSGKGKKKTTRGMHLMT